jgi:transposase
MIKYKVSLTEEERKELNTIVNKGTHPATRVKNALILLNCDESQGSNKFTNEIISKIVRVSMKTIDRVKKKFVEEGFEAVLYPGKTKRIYIKKFDGDLEAHLVALCCSEPPEGYARWSLRLLADKIVELKYVDDISHETVRQILKKTKSSPGKV